MVAELFDPVYGRKTATLGVDAPLAASGARDVGAVLGHRSRDGVPGRPTRRVRARALGDGTQVWRITHDGIESHSIHFGAYRRPGAGARARATVRRGAPDPGELGWKDTLRVDPLESRASSPCGRCSPRLPFKLAASARPLDVTRPDGATGGFTDLDPLTADPITVVQRAGGPRLGGGVEPPPAGRRGEPHDEAAGRPKEPALRSRHRPGDERHK